MTKHEQTIQEFLRHQKEHGWQRYGLRKRLNAIFDEEIPHLQFIPDAFRVDVSGHGTVTLLEVDGHSMLTPVKLKKIVNLWYELDVRSWSLNLITINLFTGAVGKTPDIELARIWLRKDYGLA